ncbi:MAG: helix-turn-helix transcriptional regulator [Deltaproteobacteria bacterium]|nr:helix-turn-helix transcriptional regulator [Deltaproteobacteria bacterium]
MDKNKNTNNGIEILHRRYVGDDPERKASLQAERVNAEVARTIYELRNEADMTQKELARLVGTTQSVISRLEDADYNGHSLSMLNRIAKALNRRLSIEMTDGDDNGETIRFVFREVVRGLRRDKGLDIDQFAKKSGIDRADVIAMERSPTYKPTPLILHKLSQFYKVSQRKLAVLAGAIREVSPTMQKEASQFAAQSESFSKLTDEERKTLDNFVRFLRAEDNGQ